jgi:cell cycle checkpoint protein
LHYLEASTPSLDDFFAQKANSTPIIPIVMIISESLLTTSTASADSFSAHRLLGPEILSHAGTTVIEFNPIAATFMSKALDLVLKKEARKSGRRFAPGPPVLRHLSETGDVRSAISSLEFFCLHQGGESDYSGKIQFSKSKKGAGETALTSMERQSLQMITQRENTLGIFHAVGKVVYNKREVPKATDTPPPQPPVWLPEHRRPKASEVDVDGLLNELGTDISSFILALHENYPLSCNGATEEDTVDCLNGCIDSLSDSDILCPDRWGSGQSRYNTFQGTTTDALRQDEISFDTSVRGMLFSLPHPVKRLNPPSEYSAGRGKSGKGSTAFQMMYPTSLRLWRKREQIEELVGLFNDKFRKGQFDHELLRTRGPKKQQTLGGGVDTWRKYAQFPGSLGPKTETTNEQADSVDADAAFLLRGASKTEMLLERLPYLSQIERRKPTAARTAMSKQLDRVVAFGGLTNILLNEEDEEDGDAAPAEQWSTDKPMDEKQQPGQKSLGKMAKMSDGHVGVQKDIEKLVLSDDDIED